MENETINEEEIMKNEYNEDMLHCPECGSEEVAVTAERMIMVNTGDHYCHSVKTQDADAKATCLGCQWVGQRNQLLTHNE